MNIELNLYCVQYVTNWDSFEITHLAAKNEKEIAVIMEKEDIVKSYEFFEVDIKDCEEAYHITKEEREN